MEPITRGLPLAGELFQAAGRTAFLIPPQTLPAECPTRWVWYAPTLLPEYPDELEEWTFRKFLDAGVAVAGLDVGESYGSPAGRAAYDLSNWPNATAGPAGRSPSGSARARGTAGREGISSAVNWSISFSHTLND